MCVFYARLTGIFQETFDTFIFIILQKRIYNKFLKNWSYLLIIYGTTQIYTLPRLSYIELLRHRYDNNRNNRAYPSLTYTLPKPHISFIWLWYIYIKYHLNRISFLHFFKIHISPLVNIIMISSCSTYKLYHERLEIGINHDLFYAQDNITLHTKRHKLFREVTARQGT